MDFEHLSIQQILQKYEFPHRFLVYFASQCAKDAQQYNKKPDPRSLKAIEIAERFGNGEEFTQEFLKETANSANAARAADYAAAQEKYKQLLIDLIDSRLTQLERLLIFG